MAGVWIVFEGGEGAGKSTQIRLLSERLQSLGLAHRVTREPGGSKIGKEIRALILSDRHAVVPRAELLLYEADRAQHIEEVIRPSLDDGMHVLCDRHTDSSLVYQGMARGLGEASVRWLNRFAVGGLLPDLVVVLDIPPVMGLARARGRTPMDRIEKESVAFHEKVRRGFKTIARRNPRKYRIFDARLPEAKLAEQIADFVMKKLSGKAKRGR